MEHTEELGEFGLLGDLIYPESEEKAKAKVDEADAVDVIRNTSRKLATIAQILNPPISPGIMPAMRKNCAEAVKDGAPSFTRDHIICLNKNDDFKAPVDEDNDEAPPRLMKSITLQNQPKKAQETEAENEVARGKRKWERTTERTWERTMEERKRTNTGGKDKKTFKEQPVRMG